jgi:hypothetical protein
MIPKAELLTQMQANRQALINTIEGVPEDVLARPNAVGTWSALDILAHITAWDGETLRRIAFATGQSNHPPHDIDDDDYWLAWNDEQIEIKRVLGPRGIKVDMAGTWARLLAQIEALSELDYVRWAEIDPHAFDERHDLEHARQLQVWRETWERSRPWWQRLRRKFSKPSSPQTGN